MNTDLTTCPFCNHVPMGISNDKDPIHPLHRVACVCGAMGPIADTESDAAAQWNAWRAAQDLKENRIETGPDLLRALYGVLEAARKIPLKNLPESTDSHEAVSMADHLHSVLQDGQREHAVANIRDPDLDEWANEKAPTPGAGL